MSEHRHQRDEELPADPAGIEEPHDVLAAEEFGIGTRDDRYPADPTGIQAPHDVLAAEEFAMPAPGSGEGAGGEGGLRAWLPVALAGAVALALLRRLRS
jgi:hypothetical protein